MASVSCEAKQQTGYIYILSAAHSSKWYHYKSLSLQCYNSQGQWCTLAHLFWFMCTKVVLTKDGEEIGLHVHVYITAIFRTISIIVNGCWLVHVHGTKCCVLKHPYTFNNHKVATALLVVTCIHICLLATSLNNPTRQELRAICKICNVFPHKNYKANKE